MTETIRLMFLKVPRRITRSLGVACLACLAACWPPVQEEAPPAADPPQQQVAAARPPLPTRAERACLIRFEGVITPRLEQYCYRKLDQAREDGADLVIIEIDSPGGYLDASLNLAAHFRDLEWADTVAFVPDEALSGAAIMALGCDHIVMHPNARLGDAGPIFQGEDALFRHAPEKIRSDLARRVRDLAEAQGRPPALAEAMVDMDLEVFRVRHKETGRETFMSDAEIQAAENPAVWEKLQPVFESRKDKFLEVNGSRAVELQLAEATVRNADDLRKLFGIQGELTVLQATAVDTTVYVLSHPLMTGLLLVVGLVALYVEFSAPGIGIGGMLSVLCFALFFWSRFLGGTAGWLEVILFLLGLAFVGVEIFVIPGFGVAGITGILLLLGGLLMATQHHILPQSSRDLASLGTYSVVVLTSLAGFFVSVAVLSQYMGRLPVFNRLILGPPNADPENSDGSTDKMPGPPESDLPVQVGDWGTAESPLRPAGKAVFGDEYLDVVTDGSFVDSGRQVRIIRMTGNRIVVREVDDQPG